MIRITMMAAVCSEYLLSETAVNALNIGHVIPKEQWRSQLLHHYYVLLDHEPDTCDTHRSRA